MNKNTSTATTSQMNDGTVNVARKIIGCVLLNAACMADVASVVEIIDFAEPEQLAYAAMLAVHRAGHVVTTDRLFDVLREGGALDQAMIELLQLCASIANDARRAPEYARQLRAEREASPA